MYWEVLADIFIEPADLILPGQDLAAPGLPGEDEIVRALASSPVRRTLDEGLCDVLFQEYREQRSKTMVIFLGVAMMMAGVWIDEADLRHLRRVARALRREPNGGYQRGKLAYGLRNVGQVQVAAAARHYEQGTPRKFFPWYVSCSWRPVMDSIPSQALYLLASLIYAAVSTAERLRRTTETRC